MSRLAQLVERKTLNLVVVGSSPTVGVLLFNIIVVTRLVFCASTSGQSKSDKAAPVAQLAARGSHNPKVASSILAGSIILWLVVG